MGNAPSTPPPPSFSTSFLSGTTLSSSTHVSTLHTLHSRPCTLPKTKEEKGVKNEMREEGGRRFEGGDEGCGDGVVMRVSDGESGGGLVVC